MRRIVLITLAFTLVFPVPGMAANSSRSFGGVGIDGVPQADGQIVVRQLVAGGPAHTAGIRIGDIITHIDSKPTRGSDFNQMVAYRLRGRTGTKVQLNLVRPGKDKPLRFILTRRQLRIPSE